MDKKTKFLLCIVVLVVVVFVFYKDDRGYKDLRLEKERLEERLSKSEETYAEIKNRLDSLEENLSGIFGINRRKTEQYDFEQYKDDPNVRYVAIYYKNDDYYHSDEDCAFVVSKDKSDYLDVTLYEAVVRGFRPCPNCFYPKVDIRNR